MKFKLNKKLITGIAVIIALTIIGVVGALNGWFGGGNKIPDDTWTRGLVGYWNMDEGAGTTAYDGSGNSNTGTLTNGPVWTNGKIGSALSFDGIDDYVDVGSSNTLNFIETDNKFSFGGWVKLASSPPSNGELATIVSKWLGTGNQRSYVFGINYTNNIQLNISMDGATSGMILLSVPTININQWYHITVTGDVGTDIYKIYINGTEVSTTGGTAISSIYNGTANINIGTTKQGTEDKFDGLIDEVRIYNRVLSSAEVSYHYNRGGPVAQWKFDENITESPQGSILFNDGFESGTTSAWTGTFGTVEIVTNPVHSGIYTVKTTDNNSGLELAVADLNTVFFRGYYRLPVLPDVGVSIYLMALYDDSYGGTAQMGIRNFGGQLQWFISTPIQPNVYVNFNILANTWYCVELQRTVGNGDAVGSLWIDGSLIAQLTNETILIGAHHLLVGAPEKPAGFVVYSDDYVASDSYIGPEKIVYDSSVNGNDGIIFGATSTSGKYGSALNFDGVNDYVEVSDNSTLDITDAITIGAWAKEESAQSSYPINSYIQQISNVDSVADVGSHSNFTKQQTTADSDYDTLTEADADSGTSTLGKTSGSGSSYTTVSGSTMAGQEFTASNTGEIYQTTFYGSGSSYYIQQISNVDSVADVGTHSTFANQQSAPDSIYDTLTEANTGTSGDFIETFTSFIPASTGWQDYDLYTNTNIPKGAVVEIVASNGNAAADIDMGLRIKGSSLNRYLMLGEAESGGVNSMTWYVKSDTDGYIQYYASSTTTTTFYILGYWTGVDFTEEFSTISAAGTAWEDETLSAASRVFAITAFSRLETGALTMGVRANGGAIGNRYFALHECENVGNGGTAQTFLVKSDASAIIDIYTSATATGTFRSQGYFSSELDFVEKWQQINQASTNWVDADLSAYLDQDGRTVSFILDNGEVGTENNEGLRNNNQASGDRYILVHESESASLASNVEFNGFTATSTTDGSGVVELYTADASMDYFMLQGYYIVNANANYKLEIEEQFTGLPYAELSSPELHVVTGSFNGAETLSAQVWNGSWNTLGALTASQDNTFDVSSYVTSANLYIRFIDGTQSDDTVQSTWQIDSVRISATTTNTKAVITDSSGNILTNGVSNAVGVSSTEGNKVLTYTAGSRPMVTAGQTYWIMIIPTSSIQLFYSATTGGTSKSDSSNSYTTPTSPTDASSGTINYRLLYADINNFNYRLELEEQFTGLPYAELSSPELHVVTGSFNGAETLSAQVWNGSWNTLGALTASQDNTFDVSSYVTSANLYIRFIDGTQSNDAVQSTWQIDSVRISATISVNSKILSKGNDAYSLLISEGYINNNVITASVSDSTVWHHYMMTYDGAYQKLYIDGVLSATVPRAGAINTNSTNLKIGEYFNGIIDDVRIYNYARTPDEIRLDYNAGFAAKFGPTSSCEEDPGSCMTKGLEGYWSMDEGAGTIAYDASGNNNDGTLTNGPKWTQGAPRPSGASGGGGLSFDGIDDYVDVGVIDFNYPITYEAWIKPEDILVNYQVALGRYYYGYSLGIQYDDFFWNMYISDTNYEYYEYNAASIGQWGYLVATYDGQTLTYYLNGSQVHTEQVSGNLTRTSSPWQIGSDGNSIMYFNGTIDDVRIYNRTLSAEEIRYHYNGSGPVAHWKFDEVGNSPQGIFNDGFESGTTSAWTDTVGTPTIVTSPVSHGTYAMQTANNTNSEVWLDLTTSQTTLYARGLFLFPAIADATNEIGLLSILNASWEGAHAWLKTVGTNRYWTLRTTSGDIDVLATINPSQWYTIEIERVVGSGNGIAKLWVNGELIISKTTETMTGNSDIIEAGNLWSSSNFVVNVDSIVVSDSYIGPEEIAYDSSGNGNDGDIFGATSTTGKYNSALSFDGGDYVQVPDSASLDITDAITLEAWAKEESAQSSYNSYIQQISNVDSVADVGTHSTFANQQTAPDSTYDTLTEVNIGSAAPDIAKTGTDTSGTGNSLTLSFNHTLVSGDNRLVVVSVGIENADTVDVSGVTYGGNAMTKANDALTGSSGTRYLTEVWYILEANLPADGSRSVAITCSGTASTMEINGFCSEYTGVAQQAPESTDSDTVGAIATITSTISPSTGAYVISAVGSGNAGSYAHPNQIEVLDFGDASSQFAVAELRGGNGETSLSSTFTGTQNRQARVAASFAKCADTTNYRLELEEQFTGLPYAELSSPELHVVTGSFNGAETLSAQVWNGSWNTLGALTASQDNTFDVSSYVTSANLYIRFIDGTQSNDAVQSTWQIDSVRISATISSSNAKSLSSKGNNAYSLLISSDGLSVQGYINSNEITASISNSTAWHHYMMTYDGAYQKLYIDGVLSATVPRAGAINTNSTNLKIGEYFNGIIDDVRIYNYVRNADEIRQDYNAGFAVRFGPSSTCNDDPGRCMTQGLVGYWSFNEGGGITVTDESGNENNGTLINNPKWTKGKVGSALSFDGIDDYVEIASSDSLNPGTSSFTVEAWFKQAAVGNLNVNILYCKEGLYEASAGGWYFTYAWQPHWNWDGDTFFPVNVGEWYHATVVYDKSNQYVYKNGVLVYSRAQTGDMGTNTNALRIGARGAPSAPYDFFPGLIDEVRIYDRALSAEEVRYHYNRGGPVAQWKFSEGITESPQESILFNDGFERGNFDKWDGISVSGGDTLETENTIKYHGSYGMHFKTNGNWESANSYRDVTVTGNKISVRFYLNVASSSGYGGFAELQPNGGGTYIWHIWFQDNGKLRFQRNYPSTGDWDVSADVYNFNTWHSIEIEFFKDTSGYYKIYVDGALKYTDSGNTTGAGTIGRVLVGDFGWNMIEGYIDSVVVSDSYIGPEKIAYDSSENGNDGLVFGAESAVGKFGSALSFDGVNDYVQIEENQSLCMKTAVAMEAWIKIPNGVTGQAKSILGGGGDDNWSQGYDLYYDADSNLLKMRLGYGDGSQDGSLYNYYLTYPINLEDNLWHHISGVFDRPNAYLYLDGIKVASGINNNDITIRVCSYNVGAAGMSPYWEGGYFEGLIDDARIYNYARTPAQILQDYNSGFSTYFK